MSRDGKSSIDDVLDRNREFVWQLAQRGAVEVMSRQIVLLSDNGLNLKGIKLPAGCQIEYVCARPSRDEHSPIVQITFGWPYDQEQQAVSQRPKS